MRNLESRSIFITTVVFRDSRGAQIPCCLPLTPTGIFCVSSRPVMLGHKALRVHSAWLPQEFTSVSAAYVLQGKDLVNSNTYCQTLYDRISSNNLEILFNQIAHLFQRIHVLCKC